MDKLKCSNPILNMLIHISIVKFDMLNMSCARLIFTVAEGTNFTLFFLEWLDLLS